MLAPTYVHPYKKGQYRNIMGESYILIAQYDESGLVELETVHPFGSSNRPESPHYSDQMPLYVKQELKKMTLDKETIFKEAVKIYSPGER